jgi:hypothetical protein
VAEDAVFVPPSDFRVCQVSENHREKQYSDALCRFAGTHEGTQPTIAAKLIQTDVWLRSGSFAENGFKWWFRQLC